MISILSSFLRKQKYGLFLENLKYLFPPATLCGIGLRPMTPFVTTQNIALTAYYHHPSFLRRESSLRRNEASTNCCFLG